MIRLAGSLSVCHQNQQWRYHYLNSYNMADMDISKGISPQETNFLELLLQKVSVILWSSHSQNDSGDLRGVAGGDGELGCLCGKAGTSHLCDGSAHSSGCVVNGSNAIIIMYVLSTNWTLS